MNCIYAIMYVIYSYVIPIINACILDLSKKFKLNFLCTLTDSESKMQIFERRFLISVLICIFFSSLKIQNS